MVCKFAQSAWLTCSSLSPCTVPGDPSSPMPRLMQHAKATGRLYTPMQPSPLRMQSSSYARSSTNDASSSPDRLRPLYPSLGLQKRSSPQPIQRKPSQYGVDSNLLSPSNEPSASAPPAIPYNGGNKKRQAMSEASYDQQQTGSAPPATKRTKQSADRQESAGSKKRPAQSEAGESTMPAQKNRKVDSGDEAEYGDAMQEGSETAQDTSDHDMETATPEKQKGQSKIEQSDIAQGADEDLEEAEQRLEAQKAVKAKIAAKQQKTKGRQVSGVKAKDTQTQTVSTSLEDKERQPGDTWENAQGDLFRLDEDGETRRKIEMYEEKLKYRMPKDSKHPDRNTKAYVLTSKWLTQKEWEEASAQLLLKEQAAEREERDRPPALAADEDVEMGEIGKVCPLRVCVRTACVVLTCRTCTIQDADGPANDPFYAKGSGLPLRVGRSSADSSPRYSPAANPNGRIRLSSTTSATNSPYSSPVTPARTGVRSALVAGKNSTSPGYGTLKYEPRSRMYTEQKVKEAAALRAKQGELEKAKQSTHKVIEPPTAAALASTTDSSTSAQTPPASAAPGSAAPPFSFSAPKADDSASKAKQSVSFAPVPPPPSLASSATPSAATPTPSADSTAPKAAAPVFSFGKDAPKSTPPSSAGAPATEQARSNAKDAVAASTFSFGSPAGSSGTTQAASTASEPVKPPSLFAPLPTKAAEEKPAGSMIRTAPANSTPNFSFGTPSKPADATQASIGTGSSTPSFSFGAKPVDETPKPAADASKPTFSFGAPKAAESAGSAAPTPSEPAKFAFGGNAPSAPSVGSSAPSSAVPLTQPNFAFGASAPSSSSSGTPTFSFGASKANAGQSAQSGGPIASTTPSFSFGAPKTESPAAAISSPAPTFNFGSSAPTAPSAVPSAGTPGTSAPTFSFGAKPSASSTAPASTGATGTIASPSFSFGGGSQSATAPAPAPAPTSSAPAFSFGSSGGGAPSAAPAAKPSFSFGAGGSSNTAASTPGTSAPSFNFGGPTPATSTNAPSFSFGSSSSGASASSVAAPMGQQAGFSFGQPSSTPSATAGAPSFAFGAPAPASGNTNAVPGVTQPTPSGTSSAGAPKPAFSFNFGSSGQK